MQALVPADDSTSSVAGYFDRVSRTKCDSSGNRHAFARRLRGCSPRRNQGARIILSRTRTASDERRCHAYAEGVSPSTTTESLRHRVMYALASDADTFVSFIDNVDLARVIRIPRTSVVYDLIFVRFWLMIVFVLDS